MSRSGLPSLLTRGWHLVIPIVYSFMQFECITTNIILIKKAAL